MSLLLISTTDSIYVAEKAKEVLLEEEQRQEKARVETENKIRQQHARTIIIGLTVPET